MYNVRLYEKRKKKMRRKLLIVSMLVFAMMGLTSCGSKSADADESVQTVETVQSVDEEESSSDEIEQQSETAADEASTELETEEAEESGQDGSEVTWYMDSEGIKNDKLGVVIRKADDEGRVLKLSATLKLDDTYTEFYCYYYNEDIDTYISENPRFYELNYLKFGDMQKARIGNIEYAYALGGSNSALVTFVENGIAVFAVVHLNENETIDDYLNRLLDEGQGIGFCNDFNMDCMAYMSDDGLYCPALGMKFTTTGFVAFNAICDWEEISSYNSENLSTISFIRFDEWEPNSYTDVKDAQEAAEKWIEDYKEHNKELISKGWVTIKEEMETRNFGKFKYIGTGLDYDAGVEKNFYSDNAGWSIRFIYYDDAYKDCINCIESME